MSGTRRRSALAAGLAMTMASAVGMAVPSGDVSAAPTVDGPELVADLNDLPGSGAGELVQIGSSWYFRGNDGVHGDELWISDGTESGTRMIADLNPFGDSLPSNITEFDGEVYFTAKDGGTYGYELWRTDGVTIELVEDIAAGSNGGLFFTHPLYVFDGHLYFTADDGSGTGDELWRTDGVVTELFMDITGDWRDSDPEYFATVDDLPTPTMFFRAGSNYSGNGVELWALEAGAAAPVEIDLIPGSTSSYPSNTVAVDDVAYVVVSESAPVYSTIWRIEPDVADPGQFEGTSIGGRRIGEMVGVPANDPTRLVVESGSSTDAFDAELYVVPNSTSAPVLVEDINPGSGASSIDDLTAVGNRVVFSATDGTSGSELWTSNEWAGGSTVRVADIAAGAASSSPQLFTGVIGDGTPYVVFSAMDDSGDREPWISDFTTPGTERLDDVLPTGSSNPRYFSAFDETVLFVATTADYGTELMSVDLSAGAGGASVDLAADVNPTTDGAYPGEFAGLDDTVLFAYDDGNQSKLGSYDPATGSVSTFYGTDDGYPNNLTTAGDLVFFANDDPVNGTELWATDGTGGGTELVLDIEPGSDSSSPDEFAGFGDRLVFAAETAASGDEAWISDGTAGGTFLLVDADPSPGQGGSPDDFTSVGDQLFFAAEDGTERWLWVSDGTPAGTDPVITGPGAPTSPDGLVALGDEVVFESNGELWASDGTAVGTRLIDTATDGVQAGGIEDLVVAGDHVFFFAEDGAGDAFLWVADTSTDSATPLFEVDDDDLDSGGIVAMGDGRVVARAAGELVISDGTVSGTASLPEIVPGPDGASATPFASVNGVVFLTAIDDTSGKELWYTDGVSVVRTTERRAGPTYSIEEGTDFRRSGEEFFVAGDRLYLQMFTPTSEEELHVVTVTPSVPAAPTGVSATATGDHQAKVSWTASDDVPGAAVSGYVVTSSPGSKSCSTSGATSCTVSGLAAGTSYTFTVRAENRAGVSAPSASSNSVTMPSDGPGAELDDAARFVPLAPTRLFDTRPEETGYGPKGKLDAGDTIDVQVTGRANVPDGAVAVVMNVTVTDTEAPGFVTAYPTGSSRPNASSINIIEAGQVRPNLVTVSIGDGGKVSLYSLGAAHLLADVAGYYVDADAAVDAGRFVPLTPQRVFDTREAEPAPGPKGFVPSGETIDVQVAGVGDVPASGVDAVVINLTATGTAAPGLVTGFPTGQDVPLASNVNFVSAGATAPNLAIIPLGDDGQLSFFVLGGAHVLGDVTGYITDDTAPVTTDGLFVPLEPTRVFDTREEESPPGPKGYVPADGTIDVQVAGAAGIPDDAAAVVLNVTGVESPIGFLTVWERGPSRPTASTLNFAPPIDVRANAAMVPVGVDGQVSFYTLNGSDMLADTAGYFLG